MNSLLVVAAKCKCERKIHFWKIFCIFFPFEVKLTTFVQTWKKLRQVIHFAPSFHIKDKFSHSTDQVTGNIFSWMNFGFIFGSFSIFIPRVVRFDVGFISDSCGINVDRKNTNKYNVFVWQLTIFCIYTTHYNAFFFILLFIRSMFYRRVIVYKSCINTEKHSKDQFICV